MLDLEVKTKSPKKQKALEVLEKLPENVLSVMAGVPAASWEKLTAAVAKNPKLIDTALKFA